MRRPEAPVAAHRKRRTDIYFLFYYFIFQDKTANQQIGLPNSLEASEAAAAVHHETGETKERIIGATSGHR